MIRKTYSGDNIPALSTVRKIFDDYDISITDSELRGFLNFCKPPISDSSLIKVSGGTEKSAATGNASGRIYGRRKSQNTNFIRGGKLVIKT